MKFPQCATGLAIAASLAQPAESTSRTESAGFVSSQVATGSNTKKFQTARQQSHKRPLRCTESSAPRSQGAFPYGGVRSRARRTGGTAPLSMYSSGNELTPTELGAQLLQSGKPLKLGVLLLNLGGPERMQDVEPFLYNLFADPDIIRLPSLLRWLQDPIAKVISKRRAPQSRHAYESIGGGSPIVRWTNAQAAALEANLGEKGLLGTRCYVAMRYWHPFTEEALAEIQKDGCNALVVLPLYPQYSISTSGSSLRVLQEAFASKPEVWGPKELIHTVVSSWYNRPGYVDAVAQMVAQEVGQLTEEQRREGVHVLFSAHGVPKSYIEAGDPYQAHVEECVRLIQAKAREYLSVKAGSEEQQVAFELSYQSRVGPVEWLRPYTDDKIRQLAGQGCSNMVVVPISFVSEHVETLEEMDIEYRECAEAAGIKAWRRVPALNTNPAFINDMGDMVIDALTTPAVSVSEAVSQYNCNGPEQGPLEKLLGLPPVPAGTTAGSGRARLAQLEALTNRLATLSSLVFIADGFGREIWCNSQLPIHM